MQFRIKVTSALAVLEKNLAEHLVEFEEASQGWITKVTAALREMQQAVDRDGVHAGSLALAKVLQDRPKDVRLEYTRYIGAMKRAQADGQDIIEMDEHEYDLIFNDNWNWRTESKFRNATYSTSRGL